MLRFFLVKIYVFSFILIFSGCYYDVSIKKSSDKDSTSPKAASNLLVSTYSLSTSSSPVLSWDLCEDFESGVDSSSYEVQILKYSDNSIVKNWQNSNAGSSIGDLNLSVGESYYFQVRCSDLAGNSSSIVNSNIWTVPNILSISPLNAVSILTGETFNFVGISGVPNYVYSDSGSGYLNNSTGQYIVPLRVSPVSETILVNDEAGQTAQAQVNVQAFQEVKNISSSTNVTQGRSLSAFLEYGGALYATSNSTTIAGVNTSKDFVEILKSLDDGVTWSKVGVYQNKSGVDTNSSNKGFISIGSDFYFTGYSGKNNSNLHTFVAKSTDQGATWTTVYNSFSDYSSYSNGLIDTQDGAILLSFQTKSSSLNESKAFIYKCNLITWICSEKFSYISDFYASLTDFKKDNTGAIYIAGRKHFSMPAGLDAAQFLKSTDQGENWIILNDTLDGFDYPNDIVV
nr:hypothetical protein [Pseudobdellovibrionaceae bacterium]